MRGRVITEPTYLKVHFVTGESIYRDADVVIRLWVPQGVPAIFMGPELGGDPNAPGLLLGRQLRWQATEIHSVWIKTFVDGVMSRPSSLIPPPLQI